MTDAITLALSRKIALTYAKEALKSGSIAELKAALSGLSAADGTMAELYRQQIRWTLNDKNKIHDKRIESNSRSSAACVADGIGYDFDIAEFGEVAFFRARRKGSIIEITINSAHPFGRQIVDSCRLSDPLLMALLASWAHYELDQSSVTRQAVVGEARADWGRILRRIVTASDGFAVNGAT